MRTQEFSEGVKSMRSILLTLAFAISVSSVALAQQDVAPDTRAQEILKQARAAIWDETKSKPLQSLSINASRRFARGERQVEVEMTLEALFPDKFLQTDTIYMGVGLGFTAMRAVNSSQAWFSAESSASAADAAKRAMAGISPESGSDRPRGVGVMLGELGGVAGVKSPEQSVEQSIHGCLPRRLRCRSNSLTPVKPWRRPTARRLMSSMSQGRTTSWRVSLSIRKHIRS
jgi:hypothetical protein